MAQTLLKRFVDIDEHTDPTDKAMHLFDQYNELYFQNELPVPTIRFSNKMSACGGSLSKRKTGYVLTLSALYHTKYGWEITDGTIRHEMIHLYMFETYPDQKVRHDDKRFVQMCKQMDCSVKMEVERPTPYKKRGTKYVYICPKCEILFPRKKKVRGYCASCIKKTGEKHQVTLFMVY